MFLQVLESDEENTSFDQNEEHQVPFFENNSNF